MSRLDIENVKKPVATLYPVVEGLRCVELQIPDDDGYLWVLAGFVSLLGDSWSWRGSLDDRLARARLWIKAYEQTDWMQCMNCEQLLECIMPLIDAQTEQIRQIINNTTYGSDYPPGVPLPEGEKERDLTEGSNPDCDYDILWAQCVQVVEYAVTLVTDALEIIEAATNDIEATGLLIRGIPGLGELPVDEILGYINFLQEAVAEGFEAEVTEDYKNQLACAIFCVATGDCEISIQDIYDILYERIVSEFGTPGETLTTLTDLFAFLFAQEIDSDMIADTMLFIVFGGGLFANLLLGDVGLKPLSIILKLAVNDASSDWEILCDECGTVFAVLADADVPGNDTGIDVTSGFTYALNPTGTWYGGAGSPVPATGDGNPSTGSFVCPVADVFRLVYRIGTSGDWFSTDDTFVFVAGSTGRLYLIMNDIPGAYADNTGAIDVYVQEL